MKRILFVFAAALSLAVLGCTKEEPLPQHQGSSATQPADAGTFAPTDTAATATTATVTPTGAPPVTPAPATGGAAIASTDGEQSGVTLNVTELKRGSGGTVMLKFTVVNGSGDSFGFGYSFVQASSNEFNTIGGVHLIDQVGKKKYFVVRDSEGKCVCSSGMSDVKPGSSMNLWAKFPAPPPDVQRVTIIIPHFTPMDDVPIS